MSGFRFDGQLVLVTGSSRGIGHALALGFAEAGADVIVTARSEASLEGIVGEIRALGRTAYPIAADLASPDGWKTVAHESLAIRGIVDVVVNNAGISEPTPFVQMDEAHWSKLLRVNVEAPAHITRELAVPMLARGRGSIVMVGSALSQTVVPGNASYVVTKSAIEQLSRALAVEWARKGIRVNCLSPGFFATELVDTAQKEGAFRDYVLRRTPMRRLGEPRELIAAALFLASDEASFVTGSTLSVDGGWLSA